MKRVIIDYTTAVEQALYKGKRIMYAESVREVPDSISALRELGNANVTFFLEMEEIEEPEPMPVEFKFTGSGVVIDGKDLPDQSPEAEEFHSEPDEEEKEMIALYEELKAMDEPKEEPKPETHKKSTGRKPKYDHERIIFLYTHGKTNTEIAREIGCTPGVVANTLGRAKKKGTL